MALWEESASKRVWGELGTQRRHLGTLTSPPLVVMTRGSKAEVSESPLCPRTHYNTQHREAAENEQMDGKENKAGV